MTAATPILIDALVDRAEWPALVAAAEQLSESLGAAAGAPWPVRLHFRSPGAAAEPPPAGTVSVTVASLLPDAARAAEPITETSQRWRALLQPLVDAGAAVFLCTIFRHVPQRASAPGVPSPLLERIRRLNLLAAELSHDLGVTVVDVDRALAHIGARILQTDYRLAGPLAAEVAGHQVVWSLLSFGLDDAASPQIQETAKAFHGDLQQIDVLVQRRLAQKRARSANG